MFVKLAQILGEYLGPNTALGYVTSFSAIFFFFFRICRRDKQQTRSDSDEVPSFLRVENNYNCDVLLHISIHTGIKNI